MPLIKHRYLLLVDMLEKQHIHLEGRVGKLYMGTSEGLRLAFVDRALPPAGDYT